MDFAAKESSFSKRTIERKRKGSTALRSASGIPVSCLPLHISSIEVVQSSNALNNQELWKDILFDDSDKIKASDANLHGATDDFSKTEGSKGARAEDLFGKIRDSITIDDFLTDRATFHNIDEQREHFRVEMRRHARRGHDDEDGWEMFKRTSMFSLSLVSSLPHSSPPLSLERFLPLFFPPPNPTPNRLSLSLSLSLLTPSLSDLSLALSAGVANVKSEDQLDVFAKNVKWSRVKMLRTSIESDVCSPKEFWYFLLKNDREDDKGGDLVKIRKRGLSNDVSKQTQVEDGEPVYLARDVTASTSTKITFRVLKFPWPLAARYYFIIQDYILVEDGANTWLCVLSVPISC